MIKSLIILLSVCFTPPALAEFKCDLSDRILQVNAKTAILVDSGAFPLEHLAHRDTIYEISFEIYHDALESNDKEEIKLATNWLCDMLQTSLSAMALGEYKYFIDNASQM